MTTTTTIKRAEDLPAAFQSAFRRTTTTSGGFRCARSSSCFSSSFPLAFFVFRFSKENKKTDRDKKICARRITTNKHRYFNAMQSEMMEFILTRARESFVCSAPTGSGKTVLLELALLAGLFEIRADEDDDEGRRRRRRTTATRRGGGSKNGCNDKVVYLAPLRALVAEKLSDWQNRFGRGTDLDLSFVLLTGDVDDEKTRSSEFWREVDKADVILATPEKLDSLSRRHSSIGGFGFFGSISVALIDEIHVVGDSSRGATLEAIISRLKAIGQNLGEETALRRCRFVAVSATAPNVKEIGDWLSGGKNVTTTTWEFGEEYRPVRLETICRDCGYSKNDYLFEKTLNAKLLDVILDHYERCPSLIFCTTRDATLKAAKKLEEDIAQRRNTLRQPFVTDEQSKMKLIQAARVAKNKALKQLLPKGIAFHNASLEYHDRNLVETLFRERAILALCSTSTLALGVNLPARLVVVCGTKVYRGGGIYESIDRGMLLQMAGRAGRPGLDQRGVVVVMTDTHSKFKFENLLHNIEPITSELKARLPETINAEVASGVIYSVPSCVQWLTNTFMFTRMKYALASPVNAPMLSLRAPANNAMSSPSSSSPEAQALRWAKALAVKMLREMKEANLCEFNESSGTSGVHTVSAKEEGRIMSMRYVRFETFKQFQNVLSSSDVDGDEPVVAKEMYEDVLSTPTVDATIPSSLLQHHGGLASAVSESDILRSILFAMCKAIEFGKICIRRDEKTMLKELNNKNRIPLFHCDNKGKRITKNTSIKFGWQKLYVLTQHELRETHDKESSTLLPSLKREVESVMNLAPRLLKAAHELYVSRKDFCHAVYSHQLMKSIESRKWFDSKDVLSQLPRCGPKTVTALMSNGIQTFNDVENADARTIERILTRQQPGLAHQLKQSLKSLPSEVRVSLEINTADDILSTPSPTSTKTQQTKKKRSIVLPSVNVRVEFVTTSKRSSPGGMNIFGGDVLDEEEEVDAESFPRVVRLPKQHQGVLIVGCEHDNRIIFRTKLPTITERTLNTRKDCLVLESRCFAQSLPAARTPVKFLARIFFDGIRGRDAFGWAVSSKSTLSTTPFKDNCHLCEAAQIHGSGERRLQTAMPRVAKIMSVDAKKTKRKNDDDDGDNNNTNDDGKMTITQKRTEAGLAQMRKTKQTTLAQSSFPTPKRNRNEKNISPRTTEKNDPPTTTNITKTEINAASALRDLWGCNWAGGDDDGNDDDNAQCLAPALCEDNNNINNESKDSWDFAT